MIDEGLWIKRFWSKRRWWFRSWGGLKGFKRHCDIDRCTEVEKVDLRCGGCLLLFFVFADLLEWEERFRINPVRFLVSVFDGALYLRGITFDPLGATSLF
jgi:hypothetical protein